MKQKNVGLFFMTLGAAIWIFVGTVFADETVEIGTYYPSQSGDMKSVGVKESIILPPTGREPDSPSTSPGTLFYYDGSDTAGNGPGLSKEGLYFSDGAQWKSIASKGNQDPLIFSITKDGEQELSDNPVNGTWKYRGHKATRTLLIPNWKLTKTAVKPAEPFLWSKPNYFTAPYAVGLKIIKIAPTYFTVRWGGSIYVDANSGQSVRMELQGSPDGSTFYGGSRAIGRVGIFNDYDGAKNGQFTRWDIQSDAVDCGKDSCDREEKDVATYDNTDYQYFRIVVYRTGYDADVIAKIQDGGLWLEVEKETLL